MRYRQTVIVLVLSALVASISFAQTRTQKAKPRLEPLAGHVFLICVDGLNSAQIRQDKLQNLSEFFKSGTQVLNVESVYPSSSRPSYASLLTGLLPADHLVTGEFTFTEKLSSPRVNQSELKSETIVTLAGKAALKTLVSGIPFVDQSSESVSFADVIKQVTERKPNLALIRISDVREAIERSSPGSSEVSLAAQNADAKIGELIGAIKTAGIENDSVVFIVSVHGFEKVIEEFYPNVLLARKGYIKLDAGGEATEWIAMSHSSGGTSAVYLKDQQSDESIENIRKLFVELLGQEHSPVWKITNRKDASRLGADPRAAFFIDGAPGMVISDAASGKKLTGKSQIRAASGYLPSRSEVRGLILVSGKSVKSNSQLEYARVIDLAPTIARILGLEMNSVRGRVISGIFQQQ